MGESPEGALREANVLAYKALSLSVLDVRAHVLLGQIHIYYGRYEQALAELDRATTINSNDVDAVAGRGAALVWSGRTEEGITALETAQRIDPALIFSTASRWHWRIISVADTTLRSSSWRAVTRPPRRRIIARFSLRATRSRAGARTRRARPRSFDAPIPLSTPTLSARSCRSPRIASASARAFARPGSNGPQAWHEMKAFVEKAGILFYTTPHGRGVEPDDHPLS